MQADLLNATVRTLNRILVLLCLTPCGLANAAEESIFMDQILQVPIDKNKDSAVSTTKIEDLARVRILPENIDYAALPESELAAFADYLDGLASDLQLPGYALAIVQGKDAVLVHTVGLRKVTEIPPIDRKTLFNIGPATTALSSLLAATIDGKGGFSYDKLARRIWPSFRMSDPRSADTVSVYNLFTMTAGVPSYTDKILDPSWARPEDVFDVIAQAPVISPPGRIYEHSNVSTAAAGYLTGVSTVPGEDFYTAYTQAIQKYLFDPMGMKTATFSKDEVLAASNFAHSHTRKGPGFNPVKPWEPKINAMAPALGLKASLDDMIQWLSTELCGGRAPDGTMIANAVSIRERWQPAKVKDSQSYGMGWTRQYYQSVEIIASMGSYDRQSAGIGVLPGFRTGFVILINADGDEANRLMQEVALGTAEMVAVRHAEDSEEE